MDKCIQAFSERYSATGMIAVISDNKVHAMDGEADKGAEKFCGELTTWRVDYLYNCSNSPILAVSILAVFICSATALVSRSSSDN